MHEHFFYFIFFYSDIETYSVTSKPRLYVAGLLVCQPYREQYSGILNLSLNPNNLTRTHRLNEEKYDQRITQNT